jgi:hypothetical protein
VLLPGLISVIEDCSRPERASSARFQAATLHRPLDDLLETIAEDFVGAGAGDMAEVLAAYRRDHLWEQE